MSESYAGGLHPDEMMSGLEDERALRGEQRDLMVELERLEEKVREVSSVIERLREEKRALEQECAQLREERLTTVGRLSSLIDKVDALRGAV